MKSPRFTLRLGAGLASQADVGNKAALLDRAATAGLKVPQGIILLHEAWQDALASGLATCHEGRLTVVDPAPLLNLFESPHLTGPVAVRSAFSSEDGPGVSLAGFFQSRLWVEAGEVEPFIAALEEVWSSARDTSETVRRDVLIMRMVEAQHAGVAFTEREFEDDLVNVTTGTAEQLVAGRITGESLELPKLRRWERPARTGILAPWAIRLQRLLRDVRRVFGAGNWDIEWADDGRCCWLVQVRPVTRPTRRNEIYTRANFTEILPELPSRFMTSVIASCADEVFAYYRTHDRSLPTRRPLIDVFHGRPTFNLSLLTDMMRCWGLSTRLVTNSIGGAEVTPGGFRLGRLCRKAPALLRFGLAQLRSVASSRRTIHRILARTEKPGTSLTACIATLRWLYTAVVTDMLALTAAMSMPLLALRLAGVLEEHNARQTTVSTTMFAELDRLRALVTQYPEWREELQQGRLPDGDTMRQAWAAFLDRHGHRGIYESDIARPRLWEAPEALLRSLTHAAGVRPPPPSRSFLGWLTRPLWWQAGRSMRAREELRYHAMIGFDRIRQALLALTASKVAKGDLPNLEAFWMLTVDEACQLDDQWRPAADFFVQRLQEIERCRAVALPDWFRRFDDLESPSQGGEDRLDTHRFTGVSLTSGAVEGQAWVLSEPQTVLPSGYEPATTILVARSVDAGWIPTFACVAGVVVEIGGDLSHGSIILREIGLPAITNVNKVTHGIRTGDALRLCATTGMVERVCDDTERHEERGAVNHVES